MAIMNYILIPIKTASVTGERHSHKTTTLTNNRPQYTHKIRTTISEKCSCLMFPVETSASLKMSNNIAHLSQHRSLIESFDQPFAIVTIFITAVILIYHFSRLKLTNKPSKKYVPNIAFPLPFFGHGLHLALTGFSFLTKSFSKYGPLFRLKLFRFKLLVICDPSLAVEYYKTGEDVFSLFEFLRRISAQDALLPNTDLTSFPSQIKATLSFNQDCFPRIEEEAKIFVDRIRNTIEDGKKPNIMKEANRYLTKISVWTIGAMDFDDKTIEAFSEFCKTVGHVVLASFVFPRWMIKQFSSRILNYYRNTVVSVVIPEIEKYRENPGKTDSAFFRVAVDYLPKNGTHLTNVEISNIFIGFLFGAFGNTSYALNNAIVDLAMNPKICDELFEQLIISGKETNFSSFIKNNKLLKSSIMETVRLSPQAFSTARTPVKKGLTLGGYDISNVDGIVLCAPLLQIFGPSAQNVFRDSHLYNPTRFMDAKEPQTPPYINAWGGGGHPCPGKVFSLVAVQAGLASFLRDIHISVSDTTRVEVNTFSPMVFVEKKLVGAEYQVIALDDEDLCNARIHLI